MKSVCSSIPTREVESRLQPSSQRGNIIPSEAGQIKVQVSKVIVNSPPETNNGMSTKNGIGIQTRAITEAQRIEEEAQRNLDNNPEQVQGENPVAATGQRTPNPGPPNSAINLTVDLHKNNEKTIEEFISRHGAISLDMYQTLLTLG